MRSRLVDRIALDGIVFPRRYLCFVRSLFTLDGVIHEIAA